jgi:hypothetical protein
MTQKDNSTKKEKLALRRLMLGAMKAPPVIMETHGGFGEVWASVYASVEAGIVFEKDESKAAVLARQRPGWAVYEADCIKSLAAGAGAHLTINVLDVDPYGEPWPVFDAFFSSTRPRADRLWVVVNDGLRQSIAMGKAWSVGSLAGVVETFGNDLHSKYLDVCKLLLKDKAAQAGYNLSRFGGYYCGAGKHMTHYLALLTRETPAGHA